MTAYVKKLADVYREQLSLYEQVYDLARRERQALLQSRPLGEIIESLRSKRDVLREIETMDARILAEKSYYQRNKTLLDAGETSELNRTITAIKNTIERIMELERSNEQTIIAHGGDGTGAAAAAPEPVAEKSGRGCHDARQRYAR